MLALHGELGAGKTVSRAPSSARAHLATKSASPTFTLVQIYEPADRRCAIWRFDLFRLENAEDALELGIEDAFSGAISLIEWPDRLGPLLAGRLDLTLSAGPTPIAAAC